MSFGRALLGFAGVGTILLGFGLTAVVVRRRWFPAAAAPLRQLIDAVLALAGIVGTSLLLGSVGLFQALPLVVAGAIAGAASVARLRVHPTGPSPAGVVDAGVIARHPRWTRTAVVFAIGLVAVRWIAELLQTISRGFSHADELHYHLTHAALFAQTSETWPIRFTSIGDGAAYHPAHAELLHGVGLVVLGSDFLSIFLNLIFAAMALAAAWAIGTHAGNAPAATLLVASVLSLSHVTAESGSALNDTMAIALLLTAVAFLLESSARDDQRLLVLAGVAAGLAAGTKLTVLVPVVALTLVLLARPRGARARAVGSYVVTAGAAGGYWYLRNLFATGNPVPPLSFGPLPGPDLEYQREVEFSVLEYLIDVSVWRDFFVPGLGQFFGPLWPLLPGAALALGAAALLPSTWRRDRRWSLLSVCGALSLLSYLTTPTSAAGRDGEPFLFQFNLRYALPGLVLCGLAGLAHPALRRNAAAVAAAATTVFVASNLHRGDPARTVAAVVLVALVAAGIWFLVRYPRFRLVAAGAAAVAGVLVGAVANDRYLERRWTVDLARWDAFEAGDEARALTVGLTGFPQSYPFYGADLSNRVVTIGVEDGDELAPFRSCAQWWAAVRDADLDVVVVLSEKALAGTELGEQTIHAPVAWLRGAGAPAVLADRDAFVFDVRTAAPSCGA